jgi:hypothetical protein
VSRGLVCVLAIAARTASAAPSDLVSRPLVEDDGQLAADLTAEVNLSTSLVGAPLSLAPDVWYGVLPQLTLGLIHSDPSVDRIAPGASFCINTQRDVCRHFYRGSGLDGLYSLLAGRFAVAAHVRVLLRDLDPAKPAVTAGAALRWQRGRWAISGDPFLQLGLANLEDGNRAELWLPVVVAVQPACRWVIELHTGWNSDIAVWRDGYYVPAAVAVRARATSHIDVGATFGFESILGPQNEVKNRVLFVDVGWR